MDLIKFLRKNARLVIFCTMIVGLVIYLFVTTDSSQNDKKSTTNQSTVIATTKESTESSTSDQKKEEDNEANAQLIATSVKENRPSIIENNPEMIDGHKRLVENDDYQLFVKEDTLSLIIREKKQGRVMYSTVANPDKSNEDWTKFVQSAIVVQYLVDTNIVYYQADMFSSDVDTNFKTSEDGFSAQITFKKLDISFELIVKLTADGLDVHIPDESIKETSTKYKIGNIYAYPFLGYSKMDEEDGYLVIPDGTGALISLENHQGQYSQPYSEAVYGTNIGIDDPYVLSLKDGKVTSNEPETITSPIFGVVHTKKQFGILGVITSGDTNAKIEAYPNGAILPYNWITSKFIYRQFYNQSTSQQGGTMVVRQKNRNQVDLHVIYKFTTGEQATYVGLAKQYRRYLMDTNAIKQADTSSQYRMKIDILGADLEEKLTGLSAVAMTKFDEVDEILENLKKENVDNLMINLVGWQSGGLSGGYANNKLVAERKLGGNNALNNLLNKYKNMDGIYLNDDPLRINKKTNQSSSFSSVTKLNKKQLVEETGGRVFNELNYLSPNDSVELFEDRIATTNIKNYTGIEIEGITNHLFSYSSKGKNYTRSDTLDKYDQIISDAASRVKVNLKNPILPYWQYATSLTGIPLSSSKYIFEKEDIPFFSIALQGLVTRYSTYLNFQPNQEEAKLKLIEQGIIPSYLITYQNSSKLMNTNAANVYSSEFSEYKNDIVSLYKEIEAVSGKIGETMIEDYEKNGTQVIVTYENQTRLLLNYADYDQVISGELIPAMDYKVVSQ